MFKSFFIHLALCCSLILPTQVLANTLINPQTLLSEHPKFLNQYNEYTPSSEELTAIQKLAGKELIVFLGTWCHDSIREVPKLIKLLDMSEVKLADIQFVTVGYDKRDELGLALAHDLQYTPTFVVKHQGVEINRVVEKPEKPLAQALTFGL